VNPTGVRRALYGKLAGDGTLNGLLGAPAEGRAKAIYFDYAPDGATYPFVVLNKQAGTPTYANVTKPAYESQVWQIKAIDQQTTADRADAVAVRLDALLNDGTLSIAGGDQVMWLRRESDVSYSEIENGETFVHSGALYRLVYEPA
jgi:hypothetical protein